jgi:positive regulator of sigma E activity
MLEVDATALAGWTLRPGDDIQVEVDDGELLRAALAAYLPPSLGLLGGPLIVAGVAPAYELALLVAALAGLAAGWVVARWWLRWSPPRYRLRPAEAA